MSEAQFDYSLTRQSDTSIIKVNELRLDRSKTPVFKTELLRLIASGSKKILVNLEKVNSIDSSGLGALTFGKRQLDEIGGEISVCCLQEKVLSLFRIAALDRVFPIFDTVEDALKSE